MAKIVDCTHCNYDILLEAIIKDDIKFQDVMFLFCQRCMEVDEAHLKLGRRKQKSRVHERYILEGKARAKRPGYRWCPWCQVEGNWKKHLHSNYMAAMFVAAEAFGDR